MSLLFNKNKNQFNQKKHFQSKTISIQSKKTFSIKLFLNSIKKNFFNQRKKVFECKKKFETQKIAFEHFFCLIEHVFFD